MTSLSTTTGRRKEKLNISKVHLQVEFRKVENESGPVVHRIPVESLPLHGHKSFKGKVVAGKENVLLVNGELAAKILNKQQTNK